MVLFLLEISASHSQETCMAMGTQMIYVRVGMSNGPMTQMDRQKTTDRQMDNFKLNLAHLHRAYVMSQRHGKDDSSFSSHERIMEFEVFEKCHEK